MRLLGTDASSTSLNRDCKKLGSLEYSALIRVDVCTRPVIDDSPPLCIAKAASSCGLRVRGRFNLRSGSAGSGVGDNVGSFRFRDAIPGLRSISRARSNAFQALISSRDSGSGEGARGTRGRDGRGASISSSAAVSLNLVLPCLSVVRNRCCHERNSRSLAASRRNCC